MNSPALILGIGFFGGLGTLGRYALTQWASYLTGPDHPWGTFAVNLLGCFLFGILAGLFETGSWPKEWRLMLLTGLLGGFTTFSAFAHENIVLLEQRNWSAFILHFAGQTLLGLVAVTAGLYLTKIRH